MRKFTVRDDAVTTARVEATAPSLTGPPPLDLSEIARRMEADEKAGGTKPAQIELPQTNP
jgi:hypothetical protein